MSPCHPPRADAATPSAVALFAPTAGLLADIATAGTGWLAPHERARVESFCVERARQGYLAAHWLVRQAAGRLLSMPAAELRLAQRCPQCGGEHGPPRIVGQEQIHVSLSHADHLVAAAAAFVPVAVDVEEWHKLHLPELLRGRVFSTDERRWLAQLPESERNRAATRIWAHKECRVKLARLSLDHFEHCNLEAELAALPLEDGIQHGVHSDGCRFTQWCSLEHAATGVVATIGGSRVALGALP